MDIDGRRWVCTYRVIGHGGTGKLHKHYHKNWRSDGRPVSGAEFERQLTEALER